MKQFNRRNFLGSTATVAAVSSTLVSSHFSEPLFYCPTSCLPLCRRLHFGGFLTRNFPSSVGLW